MALTDEQEAALKKELEEQKAALKQLQDEAAKAKLNTSEPEKDEPAKGKEKPVKAKVDPDMAKSISEAIARIEKLEKRLGTDSQATGGYKHINFFGGD